MKKDYRTMQCERCPETYPKGTYATHLKSHKRSPTQISQAAHRKVNSAIHRGDLQRGPCEVCGKLKTEGHHRNGYENALDVVWLCTQHHRLEHGHPPHPTRVRAEALLAAGWTRRAVAQELGVTKERIHQIARKNPDGSRYRADKIIRYVRAWRADRKGDCLKCATPRRLRV